MIASEDDVFIFYLTKSIFFYGVLFETCNSLVPILPAGH